MKCERLLPCLCSRHVLITAVHMSDDTTRNFSHSALSTITQPKASATAKYSCVLSTTTAIIQRCAVYDYSCVLSTVTAVCCLQLQLCAIHNYNGVLSHLQLCAGYFSCVLSSTTAVCYLQLQLCAIYNYSCVLAMITAVCWQVAQRQGPVSQEVARQTDGVLLAVGALSSVLKKKVSSRLAFAFIGRGTHCSTCQTSHCVLAQS